MGDKDRAMREFEAVSARAGAGSILDGAIGHLYATTGRQAEARAMIERLQQQSCAPYVSPHIP
jgi:hypothetical protein